MIELVKGGGFENWSSGREGDLGGEVVKLVDSVMGGKKVMEGLKVMKIEEEGNEKEGVVVEMEMRGYLGGKRLVIEVGGDKGDNGEDGIWEREYDEE